MVRASEEVQHLMAKWRPHGHPGTALSQVFERWVDKRNEGRKGRESAGMSSAAPDDKLAMKEGKKEQLVEKKEKVGMKNIFQGNGHPAWEAFLTSGRGFVPWLACLYIINFLQARQGLKRLHEFLH